jgi:FixJ family two-component response regulator
VRRNPAQLSSIKFHRANIMHKMGVRTLADLVKTAGRAGIASLAKS